MKQLNLGVFYKWQPYKKINGTLFYCMEYYLQLKRNKKHIINFYIVDISDKDLKLVYKTFKDKYKDKYLKKLNIIQVKRTQIRELNLDNTLVLDIKTFINIRLFCTNRIHVFCNNINDFNDRKLFNYSFDKTRSVIYYGSYKKYQQYDKFNILKLGLQFHKTYNNSKNKIFFSGADPKILEKYSSKHLESEVFTKQFNKTIDNLFEEISTIVYVHTSLDTNNRIIPEAKYHNKELRIINDTIEIDSIKYRFEDCFINNNLHKYIINDNDIMIKNMLN